jgi:hypothetical protein
MSLAGNRFALLSMDEDDEEVIPALVEPPKKPDPVAPLAVPVYLEEVTSEQVREFKGFESSKNVFKPFSAYAFRDDNDAFAKFHRPKPKTRQQPQPLYRPVTPPFPDFVSAPSTFAERVRSALLKEESVNTDSRFIRIDMSNHIPMRVKFGIEASVELDLSESELPIELLGTSD